MRHCKGTMALAHNGNLVNAPDLRRQLEMNGAIFHTTNDSEVISYIITRERLLSPSIEEAVAKAMYTLKGAYSLIVMSPKKLIAARDPNGFRPLCVGKTENGYACLLYTSRTPTSSPIRTTRPPSTASRRAPSPKRASSTIRSPTTC